MKSKMTKRGYKLQEFLAHSGNVNCLSIGKKKSRLLLTGGDDYKVNLWAIGKPTSLMSLCGHTSPVDSVAFNSTEALVLAGASSGVIKLWNLEEATMVRGFTGHRSNCSVVEFHPFGEYLASGSSDSNLKIWDIRKKGCIQTYKGHTRGISTIKFSPDGRWVVTGGLDNVVKVWDLTAGKLLHDFTFHEGPIRSLDFHPLEFLLATGSADRTVKFWDMETFELIGSTRPEATGVRSISFHPDGRTLFCGLDDGLKVYSWEPMICHDGVDMGWSTLGDFSISEGKFIGCSYYRNSIGIWVSDISQLEPYGVGSEDKSEGMMKRFSVSDRSPERMGSGSRSSSSPDYETKEIKNIYVDSIGGNSTAAKNPGSLKATLPLESGKVAHIASEMQNALDKSSRRHSVVPRDSYNGEESSHSGKESINFSKTKPGMLLRPAHVKKTLARFEESNQSVVVQSGTRKKSGLDVEEEPHTQNVSVPEHSGSKPFGMEDSTIKGIAGKFEKALSSESSTDEAHRMVNKPPRVHRSSNSNFNESRRATSVDSCTIDGIKAGMELRRDTDLPTTRNSCKEDIDNKHSSSQTDRVLSPEKSVDEQKDTGGSRESNPVKIVGGVKVVSGRTRSLVEKFERGEKVSPTEAGSATIPQNVNAGQEDPRKTSKQTGETPVVSTRRARSTPARVMPVVLNRDSNMTSDESLVTQPSRTSLVPVMPVILSSQTTNVTYNEPSVTVTQQSRTSPARMNPMTLNQTTHNESDEASVLSSGQRRMSSARVRPSSFSPAMDMTPHECLLTSRRPARTSPARVMRSTESMTSHESIVTSTRPARTSPARVIRTENMTSHESLVTSTRPARSSPSRVIRTENMTAHECLVASRRPARTSPARVMRADNMTSQGSLVTSIRLARTSPARVMRADNMTSDTSRRASTHRVCPTQMLATSTVIDHVADMKLDETHAAHAQPACDTITQKEEFQVSGRENDIDITESIMKSHDEFLSTLQSRLTKLQIVRHYWERGDVKGAIEAMKKLTDQSVQADVVSILTEKTEVLTLDMFSELVPVLTGLLGCRTERPVNVSLEMLLKLVAVFGPVIRATVSAPRGVGVDLHADERRQICQICASGLHKIQRILPVLARRGGIIARKAQELNLVLQEP